MTDITLEAISKRYDSVVALNNVSITFARGHITAIVGKSGCGKSSLIKMCNGLSRPDTGRVVLFDREIDYGELPSIRARIGYALQGTGLFPHLTIQDNITLLARIKKWSAGDIERRVGQLLALMQLQVSQLTQYPHELSGGQQQRVGLCRAMMLKPEILLLDEPFAAIDPLTRMDIHQQLLELHQSEPITTILVTHDMQEALLLADDIVVMDSGQIIHHVSKHRLLENYAGLEPNQLLLSLMSEGVS